VPALTALVDSRPIAAVRIGVGLAALLTALELRAVFERILDGATRVAVPGWPLPLTDAFVTAWLVVICVAAVALALGAWSRIAAAGLAVCTLVALACDQQAYSSHLVLLTLLAIYLGCGDPGARWSLDARRRGPAMQVVYWPQLLIVTQISVVYLFAAVSKWQQPGFVSGEALGDFMRWSLPPTVLLVLGVCTVATELFLAAGLLFDRTRGLAAAAGVGLHLAIIITIPPTLPLVAFALLCVPTYWLHAGPMRLWPGRTSSPGAQRSGPHLSAPMLAANLRRGSHVEADRRLP
jgi:hypothetical protein